MLFDVPYASRVDFVPPKKNNVVSCLVRRVATVDVPERGRKHFATVLTVRNGGDDDYFEVVKDQAGAYFRSVLGIGEALPENVLPEFPLARRVARDWQDEREADLNALASEMVYIAGRLYAPIPEPYLHLDAGYFEVNLVVRTDGLLRPGRHPTYRIDELERALVDFEEAKERSLHRYRHGDTRPFKSSAAAIVIHDVANGYAYDPTANSILRLAEKILDRTQNVVGKMATYQIMSWVALRDMIESIDPEQGLDLAALAQQVSETRLALKSMDALDRYDGPLINEIMTTAVARVLAEGSLDDFAMPTL